MEDGETRAMLVRELKTLQRNVNAYGKMIGERIGKDNLDHITRDEWLAQMRCYEVVWNKSGRLAQQDLLNSIRRLMWLFDGVKEGS